MYVSQRGVEQETRPYRDLDADEREQIVEDILAMGDSKAIMKKWNISRQTYGHIKFHYREAIEELEEQHFREAGL